MKDFIARQHSLHPATKDRAAVSYLNMGNSRSTKSFYVDQLVRLYPDFATHWPMPDEPPVRSPLMALFDTIVRVLTPVRSESTTSPPLANDPGRVRVFSSDVMGESNSEDAVILMSLEGREAYTFQPQAAAYQTELPLSGLSRPRSGGEQESAHRKSVKLNAEDTDDDNEDVENVNDDREEEEEEFGEEEMENN